MTRDRDACTDAWFDTDIDGMSAEEAWDVAWAACEQHMLAALNAERLLWQRERAALEHAADAVAQTACANGIALLRERDTILARVAELEAQLARSEKHQRPQVEVGR